jgi:hypothetical protein
VKSPTLFALAAVALLAGGCRSDGGFDRRDNAIDWDWSTKAVVRQTGEDAGQTWRNIVNLPTAFMRSLKSSAREMDATAHLYLESHLPRD